MKIEDLTKGASKKRLTLKDIIIKESPGTSEKPLIISQSEKLPLDLKIMKSSLYVHLKNSSFNLLKLKKCQNLRIEKCTFNQLQFSNCNNIEIKNCNITHSILLRKCHNLRITQSKIIFILLILSYQNYFKKCFINEIINNNSKGNVFEQSHHYNLKTQGKIYSNMLLYTSIGSIFVLFTTLLLIWTNQYYSSIPLESSLLILLIILLVLVLYIFRDYLKMKKYPPDQFIKK